MTFPIKLLCVCAPIILSCTTLEAAKSLDISEALNEGLIQIEAQAIRADTDVELEITFRNLTSNRLEITSPAGLLFEPTEEAYQNMLSTAPIIVHLSPKGKEIITRRVYCTEANDRFPSEDLHYQLASVQDEDLLNLSNYIAEHPELQPLESAIQSAVWAVSDNYGLSSIYDDEVEEVKELRTFCSELTGKEDVWYDTETDYSVDEEGMIVTEPKEVRGELTLNSTEALSVRSSLVNQNGEEIWSSPSALHVPKGEVDIWFELKVENWPKGVYTVYYKSENSTLLAQEFTLE